jgi:hypothetical protein
MSTTTRKVPSSALSRVYVLECYQGGSFMKVSPRRLRTQPQRPPRGGRRGRIMTLSAASRRTLLERLGKLRRDVIRRSILVTLTYPRTRPSQSDSKKHRRRFLLRLQRKHNQCCVIWKLEYQRRASLHFHLLVLGVPQLELTWLQVSWFRAVHSEEPAHLTQGVHVSRVKQVDRIIWYMAKPVLSVPPDHKGRFWGVFGDDTPYLAEHQRRVLSGREAVELRRVVRKLRLARARLNWHPRTRAKAIRRARRTATWNETFTYIGPVDMMRLLPSEGSDRSHSTDLAQDNAA